MAYCTIDDLMEQISEDELIELTDDDNTGVVETSRTDRAIADADAEINGYCGKRYGVPLSPVPALVRKFSADIAIWNLFSRKQIADEGREKRYTNAIRYLQDVAKGNATLGEGDPDTPPSDAGAPRMASANPARVFTRGTLEGY